MIDNIDPRAVYVLYTSWRGETLEHLVVPVSLWFGDSHEHPDSQWFMRCYDVDSAPPGTPAHYCPKIDLALIDIEGWSIT